VDFEWDEAKRLANLGKPGLDFIRAAEILDGPHVLEEARSVGDEFRRLVIGLVDDIHVAMVFTERGSAIRGISLRRARRRERERHQAIFGG
jgi:uncharacterized DUF497 family protein